MCLYYLAYSFPFSVLRRLNNSYADRIELVLIIFSNTSSNDKEVEGVSVFTDYDGPNQDRVLFAKKLELI